MPLFPIRISLSCWKRKFYLKNGFTKFNHQTLLSAASMNRKTAQRVAFDGQPVPVNNYFILH